jgi:hypothetical protein
MGMVGVSARSTECRAQACGGQRCDAWFVWLPGKGEGPFQIPFGYAWQASRAGVVFILERQRSASAGWESEGWFYSRREAKRAMRDLVRSHP